MNDCADPLEIALREEDARIGCMACAHRVRWLRRWHCEKSQPDWPEGRKGECPAWKQKAAE